MTGFAKFATGIAMWLGVLQSLVPLAGGAGALYVLHRRADSDAETHWTIAAGAGVVPTALAVVLMMWVFPTGALVALPLVLLLSVVSPAGRQAWSAHRTPRFLVISVAVLCLGATGFLPVSQPVEPESWGVPLFVENPHAPAYPASEQYTWVQPDAVVLQSISMRLPHQTGTVWSEATALSVASMFGMETKRLHQAIELIDSEVPFVRLNPDEILLTPVPSPSALDVRVTSETVETVEYRRYDIRTTAFGIDDEGAKVGEVALAARGSLGGELSILVIVRPLAHPSLSTDGTGEVWIRDWLDAF